MSKYDPLWEYLVAQQQDNYQLSYEDIQKILGFALDHSFLTYKKELLKYGYVVGKISLKAKMVTFKKVKQEDN